MIEVNLSSLEPHVNGPFSPDASTPLSLLASKSSNESWPQKLSACLIGSCTNSSYEDMTRCADVVTQATRAGLSLKVPLFVTPGSDQIYQTCRRDGVLSVFEDAGATVLANACGPCIGQWDRSGMGSAGSDGQEANTIMTSFNRNFAGRNDGNTDTLNLLASPELVTMFAFAGDLRVNPCTDAIATTAGQQQQRDGQQRGTFRFSPPSGRTFSPDGVAQAQRTVERYSGDSGRQLTVAEDSNRLQLLQPFAAWDGADLTGLRVLIKVRGKCTTDDISAAGPWLKYKGHLDNIANNTLITAINADTGERNRVRNWAAGGVTGAVPDVARAYKRAGVRWVVIGDENYGEGSAREHAAMQPRHLGGVAVIARSFARIHETNLKKQGMLPLTFADPRDYDRVPSDAVLDIVGLCGRGEGEEGGEGGEGDEGFTPSSVLSLVVRSSDGGRVEATIPLHHTFSQDQIEWFRAGSALNRVAALNQGGAL